MFLSYFLVERYNQWMLDNSLNALLTTILHPVKPEGALYQPLGPMPNQYNPNQIFKIGDGFGLFLFFHMITSIRAWKESPRFCQNGAAIELGRCITYFPFMRSVLFYDQRIDAADASRFMNYPLASGHPCPPGRRTTLFHPKKPAGSLEIQQSGRFFPPLPEEAYPAGGAFRRPSRR